MGRIRSRNIPADASDTHDGQDRSKPRKSRTDHVVQYLNIVIVVLALALAALHYEEIQDFLSVMRDSHSAGERSGDKTDKSSNMDIPENQREESMGDPECKERYATAEQHFRAGRIQHGLEELMACAEDYPQNANVAWDIGVTLARVHDHENALSWMDQAINVNPQKASYYQGAAVVAKRFKAPQRAEGYLTRLMEIVLRLQPGTWQDTLTMSVSESPDDIVWIKDEDPSALVHMQTLLQVYLQTQNVYLADCTFKILTKLKPEEHELQRRYADFLIGNGLVYDGFDVLMVDLRQHISDTYPPDTDDYGFANVHALLFLLGGLDSHVTNLARSLLLAKDDNVLTTLHSNCKVTAFDFPSGRATVGALAARDLLYRCIDEQGVLGHVQNLDASIDSSNGFGFSPLHYASLFGDKRLLGDVVNMKPIMHMKTTLGQTALHTAVARGNVNLASALILSGVPTNAKDMRGYTMLDVACLHRYIADNITELLGGAVCNTSYLEVRTAPVSTGNRKLIPQGWHSDAKRPVDSTCDFDVRENLTTEELIFDYLALQRPVLIRNSIAGPSWDVFRQKWARNTIANTYAAEQFPVGSIPYATAFGGNVTDMPLSEYLQYMDRVRKSTSKKQRRPDYIFSSIKAGSPLVKDLRVPGVFNPAQTEIVVQNMQFFVGPAGSGAPMHYHRAAYNVLVAGRKKWVLLPPRSAVYSKRHPKDFFAKDVPKMEANGAPVHRCIQEAGDVVFVPAMWGHATLNLEESIGYASEFIWGSDEFSLADELLESDGDGDAKGTDPEEIPGLPSHDA
eukprot:m.976002 g.976002  ORF g.976002 m.976002 type:complete len:795 (+) comp23943_c0_seq13:178-2562(+)